MDCLSCGTGSREKRLADWLNFIMLRIKAYACRHESLLDNLTLIQLETFKVLYSAMIMIINMTILNNDNNYYLI